MIYRVFDIDGTLAHFDGVTVYPTVLDYILALEPEYNKIAFLTARWESDYDATRSWLTQMLGHSEYAHKRFALGTIYYRNGSMEYHRRS